MSRFSQRHKQQIDAYRYDIPEDARFRLLQAITMNLDYSRVLHEMHDKIMLECGGFEATAYRMGRPKRNPAEEHFLSCRDEEAVDFLVWCFATCIGVHQNGAEAVQTINRIFSEEGIGYELTPYKFFNTSLMSRKTGLSGEITLPTAIRKDEAILHADTVQPCLAALSDQRFANANAELMNAFQEYRHAQYGDAITDAGSAFESVLKVILTAKSWTYDNEKDACSRLLDICMVFYRNDVAAAAETPGWWSALPREPSPRRFLPLDVRHTGQCFFLLR